MSRVLPGKTGLYALIYSCFSLDRSLAEAKEDVRACMQA
jgi:hypothetical protein